MKFCNQCGSKVQLRTPSGDHLARFICGTCQTIHYQNPKIVAGSIPVWDDRVLLCRRAIEPRKDFWTLPAGFMENGESSLDAAIRETWEEANAKINHIQLFGIFSLPHISQVYLMFVGELADGKAEAGVESSEVALFDEADIPWQELAFPVIKESLILFFEDRKHGHYRTHVGDIYKDEQSNYRVVRHQANFKP